MLNTTANLLGTALKTDPTITPADRVAILAAIKNHGKPPDKPAPVIVPECRIVRRAETARRLSRSLRTVDLLAKTGVLHKMKFPGRTRAAGFLSSEIDNLLVGREAK
ncbi:MAG: hypothetical protein KJ964_08060 [Verrucomicrobia bacterium]|nr:hypothetical protein [Verrucomicrobiota bacterium]MBU1856255.1 hypothetical protein [Verrucomicrobiota bacterium]